MRSQYKETVLISLLRPVGIIIFIKQATNKITIKKNKKKRQSKL